MNLHLNAGLKVDFLAKSAKVAKGFRMKLCQKHWIPDKPFGLFGMTIKERSRHAGLDKPAPAIGKPGASIFNKY